MDDFVISAETMAAENELLRNEIEQLQYELAERDAQLAEAVTAETTCGDHVDEAATSQLVSRLEQLLDELERSDGRTNALEQLLQTAEETSRAEQEERRQLEAWMTDIEARVTEREKDWEAESNSLRRRLQEISQDRDQLLRNPKKITPPLEESDLDHALVAQLRDEKSQLQRSFEAAQQEQSRMVEQIQQQQKLLSGAADAAAEIREERLQMAQQRATLTRRQGELTALQEEIKSQPSRPATEIDGRLRVFREHLREIHDNEQQQRQVQSLSTRVSRIWKRLETRR